MKQASTWQWRWYGAAVGDGVAIALVWSNVPSRTVEVNGQTLSLATGATEKVLKRFATKQGNLGSLLKSRD